MYVDISHLNASLDKLYRTGTERELLLQQMARRIANMKEIKRRTEGGEKEECSPA